MKRKIFLLLAGIALGVLLEKVVWYGCVKAAQVPTATGFSQMYDPYRSYVSVYLEKRSLLHSSEATGLGLAMLADAVHDAAKMLRDSERR